jgi:hypothetical protein
VFVEQQIESDIGYFGLQQPGFKQGIDDIKTAIKKVEQ